jgi:hypothetical protein
MEEKQYAKMERVAELAGEARLAAEGAMADGGERTGLVVIKDQGQRASERRAGGDGGGDGSSTK